MVTRIYIAILLCSVLFTVESQASRWTEEQVDIMAENAEATMQKAYRVLWDFRVEFGLNDPERDPDSTGIIGVEFTPLTTTIGYPEAKYLSTKKGWARWLVRDLTSRDIWHGAKVAVSFSGSFPALNLAVLAALQEIGANVKGVCSVGSSSWGANEIGLSWPEMERLLREKGVLKVGCSAVTIGGSGDRGGEWKGYAMDLALQAVKRSRLPLLKPRNLRDAVKKRANLYGTLDNYTCYINVGGGHASLGSGARERYGRGGWYFARSSIRGNPDGLMDKFLQSSVPCLNLMYLEKLNSVEKIVSE
jgi:poly-gamma-glutamate system protein